MLINAISKEDVERTFGCWANVLMFSVTCRLIIFSVQFISNVTVKRFISIQPCILIQYLVKFHYFISKSKVGANPVEPGFCRLSLWFMRIAFRFVVGPHLMLRIGFVLSVLYSTSKRFFGKWMYTICIGAHILVMFHFGTFFRAFLHTSLVDMYNRITQKSHQVLIFSFSLVNCWDILLRHWLFSSIFCASGSASSWSSSIPLENDMFHIFSIYRRNKNVRFWQFLVQIHVSTANIVSKRQTLFGGSVWQSSQQPSE